MDKSFTILLAGDVMLGRGVDQVLPHPGKWSIYEPWRNIFDSRDFVHMSEQRYGAMPVERTDAYVWGKLLADFTDDSIELRIVNLETAVTHSDDMWQGKPICYRMNPKNVGVLLAATIECCTLANNHVLDWGHSGLQETMETLAAAEIATIGAGADRATAEHPAIFSRGGKGRILVYSLAHSSSGIPQTWSARDNLRGINLVSFDDQTLRRIAHQVASVKETTDIAIASIHWGGNWVGQITPMQRSFAHALIDHAGIDLIHGHSSHHVQPMELYQGRLIIYGSGDLINDYEGLPLADDRRRYHPELGLIYVAVVSCSTGRLESLRMIPTRLKHFQLHHATASEAALVSDQLNRPEVSPTLRVNAFEGNLEAVW